MESQIPPPQVEQWQGQGFVSCKARELIKKGMPSSHSKLLWVNAPAKCRKNNQISSRTAVRQEGLLQGKF